MGYKSAPSLLEDFSEHELRRADLFPKRCEEKQLFSNENYRAFSLYWNLNYSFYCADCSVNLNLLQGVNYRGQAMQKFVFGHPGSQTWAFAVCLQNLWIIQNECMESKVPDVQDDLTAHSACLKAFFCLIGSIGSVEHTW